MRLPRTLRVSSSRVFTLTADVFSFGFLSQWFCSWSSMYPFRAIRTKSNPIHYTLSGAAWARKEVPERGHPAARAPWGTLRRYPFIWWDFNWRAAPVCFRGAAPDPGLESAGRTTRELRSIGNDVNVTSSGTQKRRWHNRAGRPPDRERRALF